MRDPSISYRLVQDQTLCGGKVTAINITTATVFIIVIIIIVILLNEGTISSQL